MSKRPFSGAELSVEQARFQRMQGQRLREPAGRTALGDVARSVCGINAQRGSAMALALRARVSGLERSDVDEAVRKRTLVRAWTLRGTMHLHSVEDVRWLVPLLGPALIASGARRRAELGLTDRVLARGLEEIGKALAGSGPLTRRELMDRLAGRGLALDRKSQAPVHLIRYAALEGLVVIAPDRENGEPTYALFDEWAGSKARGPREAGLEKLARRYLEGYGPAGPGDFASWSGLHMAEARSGWESLRRSGGLVETRVSGKALWSLGAAPGGRAARTHLVRLVPAFDSYLLGYSDRGLLLAEEHFKDVYHGGQTVPSLLVDGKVAGVWRHQRKGTMLAVRVRLFDEVDERTRGLIEGEAEDVSRLLAANLSLVME